MMKITKNAHEGNDDNEEHEKTKDELMTMINKSQVRKL